MIFARTLSKVLDGTKTQTRRVVQPGDVLRVHDSGLVEIRRVAIRNITYTAWAVGQTYTAQAGRDFPVAGRIKLLDLRGPEDVRLITLDDVLAEGFETPEEFLDLWTLLHGDQWNAWVLTIEGVERGLPDLRSGEELVPGDDLFDLILSDFRRRHWPDLVTRDGVTFRSAKRGGHPVFTVVREAG